ncbi:hypothetical protein [uncultured Methylobacterium sp.]|jgi:hypothetical protein|uniref:hypothetical protein n=1 Tax=uncultured Methylobacterium sp. TaxID=157278 RepID=UPI002623B352|nr:hypothetical protein [uncultured Methylobacterium sp.]
MDKSVPRQWVEIIAENLKYGRLLELNNISDQAKEGRFFTIAQSNLASDYCVFHLPGTMAALTPYGYKIHLFSTGLGTDDNYIFNQPKLNDEYLRLLFTALDFITYKICHLYLENQDKKYGVTSETFSRRFGRLKQVLQVPNWNDYENLFKSIRDTRNGFAHSFIDVENLNFNGLELRYCFGDVFNGPSLSTSGHPNFLDKAKELYGPLDSAFKARQFDQIRREDFCRDCDRLIDS